MTISYSAKKYGHYIFYTLLEQVQYSATRMSLRRRPPPPLVHTATKTTEGFTNLRAKSPAINGEFCFFVFALYRVGGRVRCVRRSRIMYTTISTYVI